mgnify:CR=1 FL=1
MAQLKAAGFSATDLAQAGYTTAQLAAAGFTPSEIARAGAALVSEKVSSCKISDIMKGRAAGVSAREFKHICTPFGTKNIILHQSYITVKRFHLT